MWNARTVKIFEELGWTEQWIKTGIETGIKKNRWETAMAMFAEGDSIEKISRVTGLSRRALKAKLSAQQPA